MYLKPGHPDTGRRNSEPTGRGQFRDADLAVLPVGLDREMAGEWDGSGYENERTQDLGGGHEYFQGWVLRDETTEEGSYMGPRGHEKA